MATNKKTTKGGAAPKQPESLKLTHQIEAFEHLVAVGKACFSIDRSDLPLRPRTNMLIIGPSGSGKTFLAREVARELKVPFLSIGISEWVLMGCSERGATQTWPMIAEFLRENQQAEGVVILLDEIDKIHGDSPWERHLRNEVFRFLDLEIPSGINLSGDDDDACDDKTKLKEAENVLKNKTLLLAAGAFQHLWFQHARPTMGFGGDDKQSSPKKKPNLSKLAQTLPQELTNRFCSKLVILPELTEKDYFYMLEHAMEKIPENLRQTFLRLGKEQIAEAVKTHQGCRFLEELLLDTILEERRFVQEFQKLLKEEQEQKGPFLE